jgi:hypothetical protein
MKTGTWRRIVCASAMWVLPAGFPAHGQEAKEPAKPATATAPASSAAHTGDVSGRDAIVAALYESISGPAGDRDWDRFRSLFLPEAQLIASYKKKDGTLGYKAMTVQGYVDMAGKYLKERAFYEREISRKIESYGTVTHIFSTYESRETADGKPIERGINSIQLYHDGSRWWIVDVYWTGETAENPLPDKYLTKTEK